MDRLGKWVTVLMFFYVVYHSIAETLPTTFEMPRAGGEAPFLGADDGDYTYRVVNKFIQGLDKYMHDPDIRNIGPGTFAGTKKASSVHISQRTISRIYCLGQRCE